MKCQILFSWKIKQSIINLSSAELAKRVAKFNSVSRANLVCIQILKWRQLS